MTTALPSHPTNTHDLEALASTHHTQTNSRTSFAPSTSAPSTSPWGPSHPCYPHPNPHVPLISPLIKTTRIIRIPRDWMVCGDLAPQYSIVYPEILDPWVSEQDFRELVVKVNEGLEAAFKPEGWVAWRDAVLGFLSGWVWEDLGGEAVGVKKGVRGVERWVEGWNRKREGEDGGLVRCVGLRRTGFLCIDIQIPDPEVRIADGEEEERQTTAPSRRASL